MRGVDAWTAALAFIASAEVAQGRPPQSMRGQPLEHVSAFPCCIHLHAIPPKLRVWLGPDRALRRRTQGTVAHALCDVRCVYVRVVAVEGTR